MLDFGVVCYGQAPKERPIPLVSMAGDVNIAALIVGDCMVCL